MRTPLVLLVCLFATHAFAQMKSNVVVDAPALAMSAIEAALGKRYEAIPSGQPLSDLPLPKEIRDVTAPFQCDRRDFGPVNAARVFCSSAQRC